MEKWIDALGESRQIYWKRFVTALILITDLFFHKRVKSERANRVPRIFGAIALSYPRVRVRATVKLSAAFFNDESSITIGGGGVRKCNSAKYCSAFFHSQKCLLNQY